MRGARRALRAAAFTLVLLAPGLAAAQTDRAEPLVVLRGTVNPAASADLAPLDRVERGARDLRLRGHDELPLLAWALLQRAEGPGGSEHVELALSLAPQTAGVRFAAARALRSPSELLQSLLALRHSYPALLWLAVLGGAVLGIGILAASTVLILVVFARSLTLHGHRVGHLLSRQDPPAWPGILLVLAAVAVLPLLGVGPVGVLAIAGALAALRAPAPTAGWVTAALLVVAAVLGPGVDYWARLASVQTGDPSAEIVWRIDRGQPLRGDREQLRASLARRPDDLISRLGLASLAKREGDIAAAREFLGEIPETGTRELHAQALNLRGILHLADGEVREAIAAFQDARAISESAAVLYNLSQAYARGMRLLDRTAPFRAARELDPELVTKYTALQGDNLHHYTIEGHIPLSAYFRRALANRPEARDLAVELRGICLGARLPDAAWMALPVLGLLALMLRRPDIRRCSRCERPLCRRCMGGRGGNSCVRCARLFSRTASGDPRIRRIHLELDRKRQQRVALGRALFGACVPGSVRVLEGRPGFGAIALFLAATGAALLLLPDPLLAPVELGALGDLLPMAVGVTLAGVAYLWALTDARRQLRVAGRRV